MSDMMDEFEFKPLTEGLGFHARTANGDSATTPSPLPGQGKEKTGFRHLSTPLPRTSADLTPESMPSTTVDEILKTLNDKKRPQITNEPSLANRVSQAPEATVFKPATWDFSAFLLDLMLVTALTLLCLIALVVTTKVDLFANLFNPDSSKMIYVSMAILFVGISWIYLVANRIFLGSTPGEWVFDQRVGAPEEVGSASYSILIAARSTIVILTGFIIVPLLSVALGRDVVGEWLGVQLLKQA